MNTEDLMTAEEARIRSEDCDKALTCCLSQAMETIKDACDQAQQHVLVQLPSPRHRKKFKEELIMLGYTLNLEDDHFVRASW